MDVSIVVPVYNALPLTKLCLKSVFEHGSKLQFEVIVVDNGSAPDVEQWMLLQQKEHANLQYLRYPNPLGFAKSVNAGAAVATGEVFIILNSDTVVTANWMDDLSAALLEDPSLGALSPYTNHAGDAAQMDFGTIGMPAAKALAAVAKRENKPNIFYLPQRITFFCVAIRREVWLKFDGLDESYEVGNFEDDDLCLRLRVAGYRLGVAKHVYVYHHNNATFSANKISHSGWMTKNAATFASRAKAFAEAEEQAGALALASPKRALGDVSVVILPVQGGSVERTLQSLANQTITDFETVMPHAETGPTRSWVAYVNEGDILYPFHLEALWDALDRSGNEAIFADGWVSGAASAQVHPDVSKAVRQAPLMLAGWMHHASIHPETLYDEVNPMHWPRLTWEMRKAPDVAASAGDEAGGWSAVRFARDTYRKLLPLETRLNLDKKIRKVLGRPLPDPDVAPFREVAVQLEAAADAGVDAGKYAVETTLPAIFAFNAIPWNSVVQREQHFAIGLAQRGHVVFYVDSTLTRPRSWKTVRPPQQVAPGVYLITLPGNDHEIYQMKWNPSVVDAMAAAVRQTSAIFGVTEAVTVVNYPRWQPIAERLRTRFGWKIASDFLDDQKAFGKIYQMSLGEYEDWLVEHADLRTTSSVVLRDRMKPKPVTVLHNAADYKLFSNAVSKGDLDKLPRPIIGFFGALADWLDFDLIYAAAEHFTQWSFVYIGPQTFSHTSVQVEWLRCTNLPNITVLPAMDLPALATHLVDFDVCTMPFKDLPATRAMNPVKVYEYLAAGKPAVCRDLPEVRHMVDHDAPGLVSLYKTQKEFFDRLQAALAGDNDDLRERRKAFAAQNDWSERTGKFSELLKAIARE
jgi:GT2 family glycosyltransferase/glycosyltransferase involved in cell wall biosynthesis